MKEDFTQLEPGDKVWTGSYRYPKTHIRSIHRVTPTQIVILLNPNNPRYESRFKRDNGSHIGASFGSEQINGVPTLAEIKAYDEEQYCKDAERNSVQDERDRIDALRAELAGLFTSERVFVSHDGQGFSVSFENLSEEKVRALALKVGSISDRPINDREQPHCNQ